MLISEDIKKAIALAIELNIPFVAYLLPHSDNVVFFADPDASFPLHSDRRFIVSGWCCGSQDIYVICDRVDAEMLLQIAPGLSAKSYTGNSVWEQTTERETYAESLDNVIEHLQNHGGKVVVSRTITGTVTKIDWINVAEKYFTFHGEAFRYIYFTPRYGCWMGASPELLLKVEDGEFRTMALAGTRDRSQDSLVWSGKNIAEQGVVRNYIVDKLYDLGLNPKCSKTETVTTGNIQHLMTVIKGSVDSCSPVEIIQAINPTPALAGYPLQSALEQIAAVERHPRRCYGGYVAIETSDKFLAYVNLRCVNFEADRWCMYVGSGIMPDSDIEEEWDETETKAFILKNLIEDSQE